MSARMELTRQVFAAIEKGDFEAVMRHTTADYRHHLVSMGIDTVGADGFRAQIQPLIEQIELTQRLEEAIESGPFVLATVRVTSNLSPEEGTIAYVLRWEEDKVSEVWAVSEPIPAAG